MTVQELILNLVLLNKPDMQVALADWKEEHSATRPSIEAAARPLAEVFWQELSSEEGERVTHRAIVLGAWQ